jgi:D-lactate dehydrogenase
MKIAFLDLETPEKTFFKEKLAGTDAELSFFKGAEWQSIDPDTEVLSIFLGFQVTRDVMDALPNLKMVACRSTGFDDVDLDAAKERGIIVTNTPGYGASSVAEYAFALMLTLSRKLVQVVETTRDAQPDGHDKFARKPTRGWDLNGKTLGVVGLGAIGRGSAVIGNGFGMRVLTYAPFVDAAKAAASHAELKTLPELLRESDVVTLHVPYTPENHHMINAEVLREMKNDALLINTARGELVDTAALLRALRDGQLGGAALDVIEGEALLDPDDLIDLATADDAKKDHLLYAVAIAALEKLPNVVITNHNAFNTNEALERINTMTVESLLGLIQNKPEQIHAVNA